MPEAKGAGSRGAPPPRLKRHGSRAERAWQGPALFSYGFRPFFLFAAIHAALAIALWLLALGGGEIPSPFAPLDWHRHEMLYGYAPAVIAGFLFTAVPNWTGRLPVTGRPLIALFLLWLAGRVAMLLPLPPLLLASLDAAFLPLLLALMAREIITGRNWRNVKVLAPLLALSAGNIWFHAEILAGSSADGPVRLAFAAILLLIMLIGGRITPSFTRNWLVRQGEGRLPTPFNRFDMLILALSALLFVAWVFLGSIAPLALPFALLALLHALRLTRWAGERCLANPLLLVLHIAYATIPLGIALLALAAWSGDTAMEIAALHVFGIGTIGGMTNAVMIRASLGHTGRPLFATPAINAIFALIAVSLLLREAAALLPGTAWMLTASGLAWILAYGLFVMIVGPWLLTPRQRKQARG